MAAKKQIRIFAQLIKIGRNEPDEEQSARESSARISGPEPALESPAFDGEKPNGPVSLDQDPISHPPPSLNNALERLEQDFVWIPPGHFVMGSPRHEPGRGDDELDHEVTFSNGFYLQRVTVTQGLWQAVMGNNPAAFAGAGFDFPVEGVCWQDCREFLTKLDSASGARHRLPTEAEWEYACRAGSFSAFANGRLTKQYCDRDPILDQVGWYCGNSGRRPHPVGTKDPNAWGLFDMHGNVWEWCSDWYGPYSVSPQLDPAGPRSGVRKVVRGGSWFSDARNCRCATRSSREPDAGSDLIGFRLIRCG